MIIPIFSTVSNVITIMLLNIGIIIVSPLNLLFPFFLHHHCLQILYNTNFLRENVFLYLVKIIISNYLACQAGRPTAALLSSFICVTISFCPSMYAWTLNETRQRICFAIAINTFHSQRRESHKFLGIALPQIRFETGFNR